MQNHYTPKGKHLTMDNRRLIERWKNENMSNREIAGLLGKKLLRRLIMKSNVGQLYNKCERAVKKVYSADYAQTVYQTNENDR